MPADLRLESGIIRLQQAFDVYEDAPSDPYGGVIAINRAVKKTLSQLADFCVAKSAGITPH